MAKYYNSLREDPDVEDTHMDNKKGHNANFGTDDVSVTSDETLNTTENTVPLPDEGGEKPIPNNDNDSGEEKYDKLFFEGTEEEIDDDNYYQESLENNQLYKLEREKYIDALEIIKDLSKKLLEFL